MSTNDGLTEEQRQANKAIYAGKRFYGIMIDLQNELFSARKNGVSDDELGGFAELDLDLMIAEAREIGQVPEWNSADTKPIKNLTYPKGTTGVNM